MKIKLTAFVVALPFLSFAQTNFKPGFLVNNKLDTLKGFVDYKERYLNQPSFVFKTNNQSAQRYDLTDVLAYGINDAEQFRRYTVRISTSSEELTHLSTGIDTTLRVDNVFLKVLYTGKDVSLYSFQDEVKKRYYIQRANQVPVELQRFIFIRPETTSMSVTTNRFRNQLQAIDAELHPEKPHNDSHWVRVNYTERDLIQAVATLNNTDVPQSKHPSNRIFIGTGANLSKAAYSGNQMLAEEGASSKMSVLPYLTVGVDWFANPALRKLIYRLQFSVYTTQYEVERTGEVKTTLTSTETTQKHSFNQIGLTFAPQVVYNVYNANQLQVYISAGAEANFSSYQKNELFKHSISNFYGEETTITQNPVDFVTFNFAPRAGAGVLLNKRFEISLGYGFPSSITNYLSFAVKAQRITAGLHYHFGKTASK